VEHCREGEVWRGATRFDYMSRAISTRPDRSLNAPKPLFLTADPAGGCPFKFHLLMACRTRFSLRFEKPHKRVLPNTASRLTEKPCFQSQKMAVRRPRPKNRDCAAPGKWSRIQLCFESVVRKPRQVFLALKLIFVMNKVFHSIGPFDKSVPLSMPSVSGGFDIPMMLAISLQVNVQSRHPRPRCQTTLGHMRSDVSKLIGNIRS